LSLRSASPALILPVPTSKTNAGPRTRGLTLEVAASETVSCLVRVRKSSSSLVGVVAAVGFGADTRDNVAGAFAFVSAVGVDVALGGEDNAATETDTALDAVAVDALADDVITLTSVNAEGVDVFCLDSTSLTGATVTAVLHNSVSLRIDDDNNDESDRD